MPDTIPPSTFSKIISDLIQGLQQRAQQEVTPGAEPTEACKIEIAARLALLELSGGPRDATRLARDISGCPDLPLDAGSLDAMTEDWHARSQLKQEQQIADLKSRPVLRDPAHGARPCDSCPGLEPWMPLCA